MQAADREIKQAELIEAILERGRELSLAMIDGDWPYVLPMNYGYADGSIYLHCARKGKKLDCLRLNPNVCFEVSEVLERVGGAGACEWSTDFQSVVGYGTANILDDQEGKAKGYDVIMRHFGGPAGNYEDKYFKGSFIVRIDIKEMTGKKSG